MLDVGLVMFLTVGTKFLTRKQFKTGRIYLGLQMEGTSHHWEYGRKQGTGKTLGHIVATGNSKKEVGRGYKTRRPAPSTPGGPTSDNKTPPP